MFICLCHHMNNTTEISLVEKFEKDIAPLTLANAPQDKIG